MKTVKIDENIYVILANAFTSSKAIESKQVEFSEEDFKRLVIWFLRKENARNEREKRVENYYREKTVENLYDKLFKEGDSNNV